MLHVRYCWQSDADQVNLVSGICGREYNEMVHREGHVGQLQICVDTYIYIVHIYTYIHPFRCSYTARLMSGRCKLEDHDIYKILQFMTNVLHVRVLLKIK